MSSCSQKPVSRRATLIVAALVASLVACSPKAQISAASKLPKPQDVLNKILGVSFVSEPNDDRIYAVSEAAPETTQSEYCVDAGKEHCDPGQARSMVFMRRTETSFFFVSRDPVDVPDGTTLRFNAFIAANGTAPTQSTTAVFYRPTTDDTEPDPLSDSDSLVVVNPLPSTQPQPQATDFLVNLLGQFLGGLGNLNSNPANPNIPNNPNPVNPNPITPTSNTDAELVPNPNNIQLSASEFEVIKLTNAERKRQGKTPLIVQQSIMTTARESSRLMQAQNNMVHGLTSGWNAENIAMGQQSPQAVVQAWIKSPGHYANMMGGFTYIGVGDTLGNGSPYWTQQFNR